MLEDRIRFFEGRRQRYGTQLDWDADGSLSPGEVEDPHQLAERREAAAFRRWKNKSRTLGARRPPRDSDLRQTIRRTQTPATSGRPMPGGVLPLQAGAGIHPRTANGALR